MNLASELELELCEQEAWLEKLEKDLQGVDVVWGEAWEDWKIIEVKLSKIPHQEQRIRNEIAQRQQRIKAIQTELATLNRK